MEVIKIKICRKWSPEPTMQQGADHTSFALAFCMIVILSHGDLVEPEHKRRKT
jgi:hypothetical protein